jgi:PAS domain S-box-containing protein
MTGTAMAGQDMDLTEQLLTSLNARERLLREERVSAAHARTLLTAMDVLHRNTVLEHGLRQVLEICRDAVSADLAVLLSFDPDGTSHVRAATDTVPPDAAGSLDAAPFARSRRFSDLAESDLNGMLQGFGAHRSLVSVPLDVHDEPPLAILAFSADTGRFSRFDLHLFERVAAMLEDTIDRVRYAHRNAILARIIKDGLNAPIPRSLLPDSSFDALSNAYDHVVAWQGQIIEITNEVLSARSGEVDEAVTRALSRAGRLTGSDRTYVFRLTAPDRMNNTHEWVADGIEPMIEHLQDMPVDLLDEWRADFERGQPVYIPEVAALPDGSGVKDVLQMQGIRSLLAVPMVEDGQILGFMGYDAVRSTRSFLPADISLLQSVAKAVGVVLDRAKAEEQTAAAMSRLVEERNRTEATLSAIPYLVIEMDAGGRFQKYRAGGDFMLVFPEDAIVGRLPEDVLPSKLSDLLHAMMAEADRDGRSKAEEYRLEVSGRIRWYEATVALKRDERNARAGYVVVVRDISDRRLRQRQLRRLGRIAELTSNYVIITDREGRIEWVNPAFERRSGWRLQELRGQRPGHVLQGAATDQSTVAGIGEAIRAGRPVQAELLNLSRSGDEYWISKDIQPLLDETGEIEGFVSVQTDITELKNRHKRDLQLRATAIEASSDAIGITNPDGTYAYLNPRHRTMFGIGLDEDISGISWADLYDTAEAQRLSQQVIPVVMTNGSWRGVTRGKHRDGTVILQDLGLTRTEDGRILCISRDITRQRELDAERHRMREELQVAQRRETIAQLAAGVGHDLANFIAVVGYTVASLEGDFADDAGVLLRLRRITDALEAARDLTRELDAASQSETRREVHDLRDVIAQAVDLLGCEEIAAHEVTTALPDAAHPVLANRTALLQVVLNLLLNARDSGPEARIHVAMGDDLAERVKGEPDVGFLFPEDDYAFFAVTDTGSGVDPSVRPRIFDQYITTKGNDGTGLGLPMVAGILRKNRGVLWFDSEPGRGTTVTIGWPMTRREVSDPAATQADEPTEAGRLDGLRVLIVDDIRSVAAVLGEMLQQAGADVTVMLDPEQALAMMTTDRNAFDVVVTDIEMPGTSGIVIGRRAAKLEPPLPCIAVTALTDRSLRSEGRFADVLEKPVDAETLVRAVSQVRDERLQKATDGVA